MVDERRVRNMDGDVAYRCRRLYCADGLLAQACATRLSDVMSQYYVEIRSLSKRKLGNPRAIQDRVVPDLQLDVLRVTRVFQDAAHNSLNLFSGPSARNHMTPYLS